MSLASQVMKLPPTFCLFVISKGSWEKLFYNEKFSVVSLISKSGKITSYCLLALPKPVHGRCQISDRTCV